MLYHGSVYFSLQGRPGGGQIGGAQERETFLPESQYLTQSGRVTVGSLTHEEQ